MPDQSLSDDNGNVGISQELVDTYAFRLPRSYKYADYIWPGIVLSPERLHQMRDFKFEPTDVLIASYPKSGTTWASEIVSLICHHADMSIVKQKPLHERVPWLEMDQGFMWVRFFWIWQLISKLLGIQGTEAEEATRDTTFRRVFFTHLPLELLPSSALKGDCKIIYVSRNPKDNAVSFFHFHQMARFLGQQRTSWEEFFPLYTVGKIYCGSWFEHVLSFYQFAKVNKNVLFLKYEEMKKDLKVEVNKIADFLQEPLNQSQVDSICSHCQFESMKGNRMVNRDGIWLFNQTISNFMRKGTVGDWKNYFTVAQNEVFDSLYKSKMRNVGLDYDFEL